jgi:hypothetical protein
MYRVAKRIQNLKPDTVVKRYWSNNEQFADLFNGVLFHGKQVIQPEELEDMDTENSTVLEHRGYAESMVASRDNIKIRKKATVYGVEFVLLGIEGQEHIHYAMPMRVMGYDYGSYKKQYDSNAGKYKSAEGLTEDEYLSKMKRTDKLMPVITVVVYYGENSWDGATSLQEMLNVPEEMKPFVNDYKMNLIEARKNELVLHNMNNKNLFNLLEILLNTEQSPKEAKRRAIEYSQNHKVDKSVAMAVAGAVNCKLDYNAIEWKGDDIVCTVFEAERAEGEAKGIIETGYEFGVSKEDILQRLQDKLQISLTAAQEYMVQFGKSEE